MHELARMLGLSRANATGLVDRLEGKGIVERRHSTEDRRVVLVSLTRRGRDTARKLNEARRRGLAQMMRRIPPKNLAVFMETLEQMAMGLSESQSDLLRPPRR
jgi:DNA-binding MarR family transcriptional regulator